MTIQVRWNVSIVKFSTEIRREQIIQAALELIASQGMKGVNIAGLAHRVGVVPSAIYHHFRNKDEILEGILGLLQDRLLGNVEAVRSKTRDPLNQLRQLLAAHVQLILGYSALPRILFSEDVYGGKLERRTRLNGIIMNYLDQVASIFREGQRQNLIRSQLDADVLAVMFLGLLQPTAILWHLSGGRFDATKQVERAWPIFCEAIGVR